MDSRCHPESCNFAQQLLKTQQNQRLLQFLMKLNQKYEHPKSTILMMNPVPTISKAYGLLLQEEQQKELHVVKNQTQLDSAAFNARRFDNKNYRPQYNYGSGPYNSGSGQYSSSSGFQTKNANQFRSSTRNNLFCDHCKMRNHTIDKCWKLHGYPKDFKAKGKRVAAAPHLGEHSVKESHSEGESGLVHATFTEKQYNHLMQYMNNNQIANQVENTGFHSLGLATTSQHKGTLCIFSNFKSKWVLYSGASDHMCSDLSLFSSFQNVSDDQHTITIPNGSQLSVKHKGVIHIGKDLTLIDDLSKNKHTLLGKLEKGLYSLHEDLLAFNRNKHAFSIAGSTATRSQTLAPQTRSHQNGVVERKYKHLLETTRAPPFQSNLPARYWSECILVATYLINRMSLKSINFCTPYEKLFNTKHDLSHLRVFGCLCYITTAKVSRTKFDPRAVPYVFLGYPSYQKAYNVLNLATNKVVTSRDVVFHEKHFPYHFSPTPTSAYKTQFFLQVSTDISDSSSFSNSQLLPSISLPNNTLRPCSFWLNFCFRTYLEV
ncbi:uncharacterized protein [Spinacia oleracea]|uniref:Integrase catalytic domain-containing protein n=1 Tax=Spinacia oleracea TaxID=3562 RepID=A0ABM3QXF1_SPIOL|nr:uncharacterized protein LOC130463049 [Spinacia oleracea]